MSLHRRVYTLTHSSKAGKMCVSSSFEIFKEGHISHWEALAGHEWQACKVWACHCSWALPSLQHTSLNFPERSFERSRWLFFLSTGHLCSQQWQKDGLSEKGTHLRHTSLPDIRARLPHTARENDSVWSALSIGTEFSDQTSWELLKSLSQTCLMWESEIYVLRCSEGHNMGQSDREHKGKILLFLFYFFFIFSAILCNVTLVSTLSLTRF